MLLATKALQSILESFCQTSVLVLRLEVDFVLPLSQQEEEEDQEPQPKSTRMKCTAGLKFGTET